MLPADPANHWNDSGYNLRNPQALKALGWILHTLLWPLYVPLALSWLWLSAPAWHEGWSIHAVMWPVAVLFWLLVVSGAGRGVRLCSSAPQGEGGPLRRPGAAVGSGRGADEAGELFSRRPEPHGHHFATETRVAAAVDVADRVHRRRLRALRRRPRISRQERRHPFRALDAAARHHAIVVLVQFRQHVGIVRRGFHRRRAVRRHRHLEQLPRLPAHPMAVRRRRRGPRPARAVGTPSAAADAASGIRPIPTSRRTASAKMRPFGRGWPPPHPTPT